MNTKSKRKMKRWLDIISFVLLFLMVYNVHGSKDAEKEAQIEINDLNQKIPQSDQKKDVEKETQIWMNKLYEKITSSDQKKVQTKEVTEKNKFLFQCWVLKSKNVKKAEIKRIIFSYLRVIPITVPIIISIPHIELASISKNCQWLLGKDNENSKTYLYLMNLTTGKKLPKITIDHIPALSPVNVIDVENSGNFVIGACFNTMYRWKTNSGYRVNTFEGHTGSIKSVTIFADDTRVASSSEISTVCVWKIEGDCLHVFCTNNNRFLKIKTSCMISPNQNWIAAHEKASKNLLVWSLDKSEHKHTLGLNENMRSIYSFYSYVWDVDNFQFIGTISKEGETKIWNMQTGKCIRAIYRSNKIKPDKYSGEYACDKLVYLSAERIVWWNLYEVAVWNIRDDLRGVYTIPIYEKDNKLKVRMVRVSPDEKYLMIVVQNGDDLGVQVYRFDTGEFIK